MTIREKLNLMEEIKRKNDAAFAEEAKRRKIQPHDLNALHKRFEI